VRLVVLRTFRRKGANVSASALRRQWAQGKASAAPENRGHCRQLAPVRPGILAENSERHRDYVIPSARLLWAAARLAKRVAGDNQGRALTNPAGRRELECLPLRSMAKDKGNLRDGDNPRDRNNSSAARKKVRKEHLRQGHNNSVSIFTAAPEKNSGAAFFNQALAAVGCAVLSALVIRRTRNSAEDSGHYNNSSICRLLL
jgi:hypothetical protein